MGSEISRANVRGKYARKAKKADKVLTGEGDLADVSVKAEPAPQLPAGYKLPSARVHAAILVAEGWLSYTKIAGQVGATVHEIYDWVRDPEFKSEVQKFKERFAEECGNLIIGNRLARVRELQEQLLAQKRIVEERAAAAEPNVPGMGTGYVVRQEKSSGASEYVYDKGLAQDLRATLQQAAQEVGQWSERKELTGKDGGAIEVADVSARELLERKLAQMAERVVPQLTEPQ